METEKYEEGVTWVKDVLFNLKFSPERLKIVSNKMINDVARFVCILICNFKGLPKSVCLVQG